MLNILYIVTSLQNIETFIHGEIAQMVRAVDS